MRRYTWIQPKYVFLIIFLLPIIQGGPAGGRNPSCTTQLDGTTLKESQDDTTILACGQFNYLFNLMDQVGSTPDAYPPIE